MTMKFTPAQLKLLHAIAAGRIRLALERDAIGDDVKALAANLGVPVKDVNKIVRLMMAEQAKGGVLEHEQRLLELVAQTVEDH